MMSRIVKGIKITRNIK
jgi:hypothetical protein